MSSMNWTGFGLTRASPSASNLVIPLFLKNPLLTDDGPDRVENRLFELGCWLTETCCLKTSPTSERSCWNFFSGCWFARNHGISSPRTCLPFGPLKVFPCPWELREFPLEKLELPPVLRKSDLWKVGAAVVVVLFVVVIPESFWILSMNQSHEP